MKAQKIQLSDHFTFQRLIQFVLPSILMLLCASVYGIVDGVFVSNFVGKTQFAAINLVMPVLMSISAIGFMVGTGGSAIVSKTLGEGKKELANEYFSMLVVVAFVLGLAFSVTGNIFAPQISRLLGAEGELLSSCILYLRITFCSLPFFILQYVFQSFFIAAEKPKLSLCVNVLTGITNGVLDYVLIVVIPMGLAGAAIATAVGEVLAGTIPIIYFLRKNNNSVLRLTRFRLDFSVMKKAFLNGSSEMVTNLSASVVNILYNFQLMNFAGEDGVAAYGIVMYVNIIFISIFSGYSVGSAPIVSFHYGAENHSELKNMFRKSLAFMAGSGVMLLLVSQLFARQLVMIFAGHDAALMAMTVHGFRRYALAFLIMGFNVWGSSFFTALNNGGVSAAISFLRTFVFQILVLLILPRIIGIDGIWFAIVIAECLSLIVTGFFLIRKKGQYHYA